MKFAIVVATPDKQVADLFRVKKVGALPADARKRSIFGQENIKLAMHVYLGNADAASKFEMYVHEIVRGVDGIILVCDASLMHLTKPFRDAFFIVGFDSNLGGKNPQNYFGYVFAKILRNFSVYANTFGLAQYQKLLLLPLDNFSAGELDTLRLLFFEGADSSGFREEFWRNLALLHGRRAPKKEKHYEKVYLRDDRGLHFFYGHERHSQVETDIPPHAIQCQPNSIFRFGLRFDERRHYNVSMPKQGGRVSGEFTNCHGRLVSVKDESHLNMFPNSFFGK
jgi:hypothetical protein